MDRPPTPVNRPLVNRPLVDRQVRPPAAIALAALVLGGCSLFRSPETLRGNRIDADQLAAISPGVQTRNDVQTLLGSPTQTSTFGEGSWYYISGTTRPSPGRQMALTDQRVVAVDFDGRGVVRQVRVLGEADARPIDPVDRQTPVPGNERTLLQALFGNVGRFGPGGIGSTQQQSPGATGTASGR